VVADPKRPVAIGQLRQWQGLPTVFGGLPADAEGLIFRIYKIEDGNAWGEFEPHEPAIFTSATIEFMEERSVCLENPTTAPLTFVIQSNMYAAKELQRIVDGCVEAGVDFSLHKIVPFGHTLEPEFEATGPIIAFGTFTVGEIARARGWAPGFYNNENFNAVEVAKHWPVLNDDAKVYKLGEVPERADLFFIRPVDDGKLFAGQVTDWPTFERWREMIVAMRAEGAANLETQVLVSEVKYINYEARVWVVDGRPVAASIYRRVWVVDGRPVAASIYRREGRLSLEVAVDSAVIEFAQEQANKWQPARAFCIDIARTDGDFKVIELTTMNAAGFYAADVTAIIRALANPPDPFYNGPGSFTKVELGPYNFTCPPIPRLG
jgi:hypothetical protein